MMTLSARIVRIFSLVAVNVMLINVWVVRTLITEHGL